ncbi:hypothetical protein DH2020_047689 [Rehmannia glutinosa]|uniref:Transmembrane protein n=1 Tax=Rehmannia glutinosa TaxID=99300 RepID=A0ABR0U8F2_REHGL
MQKFLHLVSDPSFLLTSNGNMEIPSNPTRLIFPIHHRVSQIPVQSTIICAANRRKRYGIGRSGKLILESAYIIASKLRVLPEPLELVLREFGAGNGGGNGFWNGFGWGGFDGWKRRRRAKFGMVGFLVICGVLGLWLVVGKELVLEGDVLFGGLGLLLFGLSVEGWRRGARDWILGFCCCAFLVGLVMKKEDFRTWVRCFRTTRKNVRGKRRAF